MGRRAFLDEAELVSAQRLIETAKTVLQLRQGQAMLLPALMGISMETTGKLLGIGRSRVQELRREFRTAGNDASSYGDKDRRGGRRCGLLSVDDETLFLQGWINQANNDGLVLFNTIHAAFEEKVGKRVPQSTTHRLLRRHGWRKNTSSLWYPKENYEEQIELKNPNERRGRHRRGLLSITDERLFLQGFFDQAKDGGAVLFATIYAAFEAKVGKRVPPSTVHRLLLRHGWLRVTSGIWHPEAKIEAQVEFTSSTAEWLCR